MIKNRGKQKGGTRTGQCMEIGSACLKGDLKRVYNKVVMT
jgi:hypothetical protein